MKLSAYHPFRSAQAREEYLAIYDQQAEQWPVVSGNRMVDTSYGQTFVRISGAVDAPPLVLLPGASVSSLMWIPHIEAFSACYRTFAVDNIYDVGRSVYTRHLTTSQDYASWLDELFTALDLGDQIYLMGASFGGWQASHYAVRFPHRLAKMVLAAPAGTVLPMRLEFYSRGMLAVLRCTIHHCRNDCEAAASLSVGNQKRRTFF
jgi:pimeloyl-ACP methyl ester carboxylesterase